MYIYIYTHLYTHINWPQSHAYTKVVVELTRKDTTISIFARADIYVYIYMYTHICIRYTCPRQLISHVHTKVVVELTRKDTKSGASEGLGFRGSFSKSSSREKTRFGTLHLTISSRWLKDARELATDGLRSEFVWMYMCMYVCINTYAYTHTHE